MITISGGKFQDLSGNPVANGVLKLQLSSNAQETVTSPNGQVVSGAIISIVLDSSGNAPSTSIWSNQELNPSGTYYTVHLYNSTGVDLFGSSVFWQFTQVTGSSVDLGTIIQTGLGSITYPGVNVPILVASINLTGQTASINTTTLYSIPSNKEGQYRLCWNAFVSTPSGVSSTLGPLQITYTDTTPFFHTFSASGCTAPTGTIGTFTTSNSTDTILNGLGFLMSCKAGTVIQYAFTYASNPINAIIYSLNLRLEYLG